jgi:Flp pilus assembly protein TadG
MVMTRRNKNCRDRGTEAVEVAFLLPLFLLVVLGLIEYGWLFYNLQAVTNAARQGARIALLSNTGAESQARTMITDPTTGLLAKAKLLDDLVSGYPTFTYAAIPGDPQGRQTVTVKIVVSTAHLHIVNMNAFGMNLEPATLSATVTMAKELALTP